MKCPECSFTFSDLRDICPKCKTDLREFKRSVGLKISFPDSSYDELLSKLDSTAASKGNRIEPKSLFDTIGELFKEMTDDPTLQEDLPEPELKLAPNREDTPEIKLETKREEILPHIEEILGQAQEELASLEEEHEAALESLDAIDFDVEISPPTTEPVKPEATTTQPLTQENGEEREVLAEETVVEIADARESSEDTSPPSLESWLLGGEFPSVQQEALTHRAPLSFPSLQMRSVPIPTPEPSVTEQIPLPSTGAQPASSPTPAEEQPTTAPPQRAKFQEFYEKEVEESEEDALPATEPFVPNRDDVIQIFAESITELDLVQDDGFEITAAAAISEKNNESIQLLFNLATASFVDKSIEDRFQNEGLDSTSRKVKSRSAEEKLKQAEEAMSAPVFSLKEAPTSLQAVEKEEGIPVHEIATFGERMSSWLYDVAILLALAVGGGVFLSWYEHSELAELALTPDSSFFPMALIFSVGNILTVFLVLFLLYPLVSAILCQRSFGMRLAHCDLYREDRKKLSSFGHHYIRHILLPVTSLLSVIGLTPNRFGGRSIADVFSGATLCSSERTKEAG